MFKRRLEEEYLRFLCDYTSINTSDFDFKKHKSGRFGELFDCTTYAKYAIKFSDKMTADEFDHVLNLLSSKLGEPYLFGEYAGYVWKRRGYFITFGFVSLNYNHEVPMITLIRRLSIFDKYLPYERYSKIADAIAEPLLIRDVNIQENSYYKISYAKEFGYHTVFRLSKVLMYVDYKCDKLSLTISPIRSASDMSDKAEKQRKLIKKAAVTSVSDLKETMNLLLEKTKQHHGLAVDQDR